MTAFVSSIDEGLLFTFQVDEASSDLVRVNSARKARGEEDGEERRGEGEKDKWCHRNESA